MEQGRGRGGTAGEGVRLRLRLRLIRRALVGREEHALVGLASGAWCGCCQRCALAMASRWSAWCPGSRDWV